MNKSTSTQEFTIKGALEAGSQILYPQESPRLDTELILGHVLQLSRTLLYVNLEKKLLDAEQELFNYLIKKRRAGIPIAYLIGYASFWSRDFKVCEEVLIPRPETELLVQQSLEILAKTKNNIVVDLGTGSGAIAGAIGCEFPNLPIIAIDNSEAAIRIAIENFKTLGIKNVNCVVSDWNSALTKSSVSLIVSNPPYVSKNEINLIDREILAEPENSIFAEDDGLSALKKIVLTSGLYLKPNGHLIVEHGFMQGRRVRMLFHRAGFSSVHTFEDFNKKERFTMGRKQTV